MSSAALSFKAENMSLMSLEPAGSKCYQIIYVSSYKEKPRNTLSTPPILALLESLHLSYSSMREISSSCSSQITVSKPRRMYLYSWIKIFTITISVRVVLLCGTSRQAFLLFSSFKKLVKQQEQKMTCSEVKMAKPKRKEVEAQNNITYCTDLIEH